MKRLTENKLVLITRRTRLDDIIVQFNTLEQAKFYIENLGGDFSDYQKEDHNYKKVISHVESELNHLGKVQVVERSYVPNFIFGKDDIIVVVGQDGLVANILKYLDGQAVVAINPDPVRWDGKLLPFRCTDIDKIIRDLYMGKRDLKEITFAKAELNNNQVIYGVNDLFIGPKTHVSASYIIEIGSKKEQHSSSGVIISTGLGSTGWLSSLLAGAKAIVSNDNKSNFTVSKEGGFKWNADLLSYVVREPFPSGITGTELVFGEISNNNNLVITSLMAQNGVIFSDGVESDFIEFNSGTKATISIAEKRGYLVV